MNVESMTISPAERIQSMIMFRARLLTLFGTPRHQSPLSDEAFTYELEAIDESGDIVFLTAYQGPSGPAIGAVSSMFGGDDQRNNWATNDLLALLEKTQPADFEATIYDDDTNNTIWYGVKDGEHYYREEAGNHLSPPNG